MRGLKTAGEKTGFSFTGRQTPGRGQIMISRAPGYYTAAEEKRKQEIIAKMDALEERVQAGPIPEKIFMQDKKITYEGALEKAGYPAEYIQLDRELRSLQRAAADRYYTKSNRQILADTKRILKDVTREDYLNGLKGYIQLYSAYVYLEKEVPGSIGAEALGSFREMTVEGYPTAYKYLCEVAVPQQLAILQGRDDGVYGQAQELVRQKALVWYPERAGSIAPYLQITALNDIAFVNRKTSSENATTGTQQLSHGETTLILGGVNQRYSIGLHKLLVTCLIEFTRIDGHKNVPVSIPVDDYLQMLGYDFTVRDTDTPEEAAKEKKRVKDAKRNAVKALEKDVQLLRGSYIRWTSGKSFLESNIVAKAGIAGKETGYSNPEIKVEFETDVANALIKQGTISYFPLEALKISDRKPNAYRMAVKLSWHWNMDNNRIRGTYNRIGVKTLLDNTDLPTYEQLQKNRDERHWERAIKDPFENALDDLYTLGILSDWSYVRERGVPLSDDESDITSYKQFEQLYLQFELRDTLNPAERIEAKEDARKKKQERAERQKQKRIAAAADKKDLKKIVKEVAMELDAARGA